MKKVILSISIILFATGAFAQLTDKAFEAKVEIGNFDKMTSISGTVENLTNVYTNLSYKLSVIKNGNANNSSDNFQEGRFAINPNEKKTLSKTQINYEIGDNIIVLLLVYNEDNALVSKDWVIIGESTVGIISENIMKINAGIEVAGIISDETKTKTGKDFYELYFKKYNENRIVGNEIVTVDEKLDSDRASKIKIYISNNLIVEFITFDDEEYLNHMAELAVRKTIKHFKGVNNARGILVQH
ncbi:CsgE family curli-type amyloid fiber assembly protein [Flavobacterium sp.]|jgi:hypothetical protein|uniref:CsgE family curli-type amyloid fiber assembly protein n=1 Tax=Flavobacterium sp. TaxID=239 RepID=UPI002A7FE760|nr:CsgE family curli-type amyloid fiber assembly protein [Flavobacterium sp.]